MTLLQGLGIAAVVVVVLGAGFVGLAFWAFGDGRIVDLSEGT